MRLRRVTPQSRLDDPTVMNFEIFQRRTSLGHFRGEPTLFEENLPSLLELPTTVIATQNVTVDAPIATVSCRFPVAPAPVPIGLAAASAPLHPPTVVSAPAALVAHETADVEVAEP